MRGRPVGAFKIRQIRFRTEPSEEDAFRRAAQLSGLTLSAWIRATLREAADKRLASAGEKTPWME